jgi:putative ABC transport system substrate-binding protein
LANRTSINILAASEKLATMFNQREAVEVSGLMSYQPNVPDSFRHAAEYVDKILRSAKPADLAVQQPQISISSSI